MSILSALVILLFAYWVSGWARARVWCDSGDLWAFRCDLTRAVEEAFDADEITIPFPTRTVIQG